MAVGRWSADLLHFRLCLLFLCNNSQQIAVVVVVVVVLVYVMAAASQIETMVGLSVAQVLHGHDHIPKVFRKGHQNVPHRKSPLLSY